MGRRDRARVRFASAAALIAFAILAPAAGVRQARASASPAAVWGYPISPFERVGYGFGTYVGSCGGGRKRHTGVDLKGTAGRQVRAAAEGTIHGTFFERGVGWTTLIRHSVPFEGTVISRYSHVTPRPGFGAGRIVSRGEVIATVYNLGSNTHFAFNVYAAPYDRWAWRGYLPERSCGGDPAFPGHFLDPTRYLAVHSDVRAPATRASAKPSVVSKRTAWTKGRWAVSFPCIDDRSGCRGTQYRLDEGSIASAPRTLHLDTPGRHTISFRSYDFHRNYEAWRGPIVLAIDRVSPTVSMQTGSSAAFVSGDFVRLDATASDPPAGSPAVASGVISVRFYFCPADRASDATCDVVAGTRTSNGWTAQPSRALEPGAYEGWAVGEDAVLNGGVSDHVTFAVLLQGRVGFR